ncbi:MAG: hypothetical protein ACFFAJ_11115 [Candidatus Hodarchaeota archaeon]
MAVTQFETTEELLGVIFVAIAVVLFLLLGIYLLISYRRTRRDSTLYISLILLFGAGALVSLVLEQVILIASDVVQTQAPPKKSFLQFSFDEINVFWLAYLLACTAYFTSACAVLSGTFFTQSFFSERSKKLLIIPAIMLALYVIILIYSPFEWILEETTGDWQPEHGLEYEFLLGIDLLDWIIWALIIPNLAMIVLLFFYLTFSLFRRGNPRWRQTLILAIGQTFLSIGYTIEIINVPDPLITLLSRFVIMTYPILAYFGFTPPKWFQRLIGVS